MSDQETKQNTEVILIVKGAGANKADDTLNLFLQGFWPAIKAVAEQATIRQRTDVLPSDYRSSPHADEPHNHITEINATYTNEQGQPTERRIWVKEAYWETEVIPESPLTVLFKEWHMASYAFGKVLYEFVTGDSKKRRKADEKRRYQLLLYFAIYLAVVLPGVLFAMTPTESPVTVGQRALVALVISALAALQPAAARLAFHNAKKTGVQKQLPGMGGWVFILLAAAFLLSPLKYLGYLLFLLALEFIILWARHFAWPYREIANSDTDTKDYYRYTRPDGSIRTGRTDRPLVKSSQLIYRYVITLALPIVFPFILLAKVLALIPATGSIGAAIERALSVLLGSVLGDVVIYAMDPVLAHRVRSVVINDLEFFHKHEEVAAIHVFAHSQGTPITFETLFHHLPPPVRAKIKTYITIGSVLSLYQQANPVFDKVYYGRFPGFPYPDSTKPGYFHEDFKWFNLWNMYDPITEFYALDEYNLLTGAPYGKDLAKDLHNRLQNVPDVRTLATEIGGRWTELSQRKKPAEAICELLDSAGYDSAKVKEIFSKVKGTPNNEHITKSIEALLDGANTAHNTELAKEIAALGAGGGPDIADKIHRLLLDEDGKDKARKLYRALARKLFPRHPASPVNLRTQGTSNPLASHFEYWSNLEEVQIPLVKRVLKHDLKPSEWNPHRGRKRASQSHTRKLIVYALVLSVIVVAGVILLVVLWDNFLADWLLQGYKSIVRPATDEWNELAGARAATTNVSLLATAKDLLGDIKTWLLLDQLQALREAVLRIYVTLVAVIIGLPAIKSLFTKKEE